MKRARSSTSNGKQPSKKRRYTPYKQPYVSPAGAIRPGGWYNPIRGVERKFYDRSFNSTIPSNVVTWSTITNNFLLNGVPTGAGATARVGRKMTIKSLMFRYNVRIDGSVDNTATTGGASIRMLIVYDRAPNAVIPTNAAIVQDDFFVTNLNLDNRDRFVVLADILSEPISKEGNWNACGKRFIKLNNDVVFNAGDTANDIGTIQTGAIYFLFAQSGGLTYTTASALDLGWSTRIRYEDA